MGYARGRASVASYMGSGSSAVTDLASEYSNVICPNGSFEYLFLHCPGGLFDLEDKLLRANNALRSDEALRTFRTRMQELYENGHLWFAGYREKVTPRFLQYADELIDALTAVTYRGFWYEQEKLSRNKVRAINMKVRMGASRYDQYATQLRMAFPAPDEFYQAGRRFIDEVLSDVERADGSPQGEALAFYDQLVLPHNLDRLDRYFPGGGLKVIVVARDPRDVFVLNKYVWRPQGCPVPLPFDAEDYCRYYRAMKANEPAVESEQVLRIWFEDLVLDYERTVRRIEEFLGPALGEHVLPRKKFDPAVSVRNIGLSAINEQAQEECALIGRRLPELLYPHMDEHCEELQGSAAEGLF